MRLSRGTVRTIIAAPRSRRPGRAEFHRCAAFGCERAVPIDFLMCQRHWDLVPPKIQARIYRHYSSDGHQPRKFKLAVIAAVSAIAKQLELEL